MTARLSRALILAAVGAAPAGAVGLGPLVADGATLSDRKGFYLTLINPYSSATRFRLYSVGIDNEAPVARVMIPAKSAVLGPKSQGRVLVIDTGLMPGEIHHFRVCAERVEPVGKALIHARVCAKLTARRRG